ncbi:hypothetical protein M885DRAFT_613181 [Pelagophyceae sp. CCMP2097]|nr:hypothetical protein M885DRAFT_613181 [Pelagophyceae sp. CCMP2097]
MADRTADLGRTADVGGMADGCAPNPSRSYWLSQGGDLVDVVRASNYFEDWRAPAPVDAEDAALVAAALAAPVDTDDPAPAAAALAAVGATHVDAAAPDAVEAARPGAADGGAAVGAPADGSGAEAVPVLEASGRQLALLDAARVGDVALVRRALADGAVAHARLRVGRSTTPSALELAAAAPGDEAAARVVGVLVDAGAVVDDGALEWAVRAGNHQTFLALSRARGAQRGQDGSDGGPCGEAAQGDTATPRRRDSLASRVSPASDGRAPLARQVAKGRLAGRDLFRALARNDVAAAGAALLALEASPAAAIEAGITYRDGNGWTPLHAAACTGCGAETRRLLALGASAAWKTCIGIDVLGVAAQARQVEIVALLLKAAAADGAEAERCAAEDAAEFAARAAAAHAGRTMPQQPAAPRASRSSAKRASDVYRGAAPAARGAGKTPQRASLRGTSASSSRRESLAGTHSPVLGDGTRLTVDISTPAKQGRPTDSSSQTDSVESRGLPTFTTPETDAADDDAWAERAESPASRAPTFTTPETDLANESWAATGDDTALRAAASMLADSAAPPTFTTPETDDEPVALRAAGIYGFDELGDECAAPETFVTPETLETLCDAAGAKEHFEADDSNTERARSPTVDTAVDATDDVAASDSIVGVRGLPIDAPSPPIALDEAAAAFDERNDDDDGPTPPPPLEPPPPLDASPLPPHPEIWRPRGSPRARQSPGVGRSPAPPPPGDDQAAHSVRRQHALDAQLLRACEGRPDQARVFSLLAGGADGAAARPRDGATALHVLAAAEPDCEADACMCVEAILERCPTSARALDRAGSPAAFVAAARGSNLVLEKLLAAWPGAARHAAPGGTEATHLAAARGDGLALQLILAAAWCGSDTGAGDVCGSGDAGGADAGVSDVCGLGAALAGAARAGSMDCVRLLLAADGGLARRQSGALKAALRRRHGAVARLLIDAGAPLDHDCIDLGRRADAATRAAVRAALAAARDRRLDAEQARETADDRDHAVFVHSLLAANEPPPPPTPEAQQGEGSQGESPSTHPEETSPLATAPPAARPRMQRPQPFRAGLPLSPTPEDLADRRREARIRKMDGVD